MSWLVHQLLPIAKPPKLSLSSFTANAAAAPLENSCEQPPPLFPELYHAVLSIAAGAARIARSTDANNQRAVFIGLSRLLAPIATSRAPTVSITVLASVTDPFLLGDLNLTNASFFLSSSPPIHLIVLSQLLQLILLRLRQAQY